MTEYAPTPQEQAAIVVADSNQIIQDIGDLLTALQPETDQTRRRDLTMQCWQKVDELNHTVEESAFMVGVASEMMMMMQEQRDQAVLAVETLTQDIADLNRENPMIDELIEIVEENTVEWMDDEMEEIIEQAKYEAITDGQDDAKREAYEAAYKNLMDLCQVDKDTAKFWARLLITGYGAQFFHQDTLLALGQWMTEQRGARNA